MSRASVTWVAAVLIAIPWMARAAGPWPAEGSVEVFFTPWDDAEGALLRAVRQAKRSVRVQAYLLTSRSFARALAEARYRGLAVEVLADQEMASRGENSLVPQLHADGIDVRLEVRYAAAHNKIVLIDAEGDDPVVVTGSYNYSYSAQARNAENLVLMRGAKPVAAAYLGNWLRHRDDAVPFAPAPEARVP